MNKTERLQAILHVIQTKRTVRAEDLAVRFNVHIRTIYRDVNALIEAGLPIGAEAGRGYFILEGHYLPPVMFTKDEAFSLLLAGKFLRRRTTERFQKAFDTASEKIRAQLRGELKDEWAVLDERIRVDVFAHQPAPPGNDQHIDTVNNALAQNRVLYFRYKTADETESRRQAEPVGLLYYANVWHLIAWCRLRKDYRDFRLDRVLEIEMLNETFAPEKRLSISQYVTQQQRTDQWTEVKLFISDTMYGYMQNSRYSMGYVSEVKCEGGYEVLFTMTSVSHFSRWLLMMGTHVRVIEPLWLHDEAVKHVQGLVKQYLNDNAAGTNSE
ncbi:MAG: YafY family transcriptional regulator [Bacteroidia bacterium]|jgi:predicted DNA-binding transcriptional regulator YafY|nr:YafY family transcriptional regulator [Bacteroidia bacterium]